VLAVAMATGLKWVGFLMMWLMATTRKVEGRFVVEKNSITVLQPYDMNEGKHDASIANFGVPQYGGSMVGSVVYPDKATDACKPFDGDKPFKSATPRPTILLVDRGGIFLFLFVCPRFWL